MQKKPTKIYLKNPSADLVTVDGNEVTISGRFGTFSFINSHATKCDVVCASPCKPQKFRIVFNDIDFGDCNDCNKTSTICLVQDRDPILDNATYNDITNNLPINYGGDLSGTVTGPTIAADILEQIEQTPYWGNIHDKFYITAALDPADVTGATLIFTITCPTKLKGIYDCSKNLLAAEKPVITQIDAGAEAILTREILLKEIPLDAGHVKGDAPLSWFTWCEDICEIRLSGCIPACDDESPVNSGITFSSAAPFDILFRVNSAAAGYDDFIQALNAAVTNCSLPETPGSNLCTFTGVDDDQNGSLDIDTTTPVAAVFPGVFEVWNGNVRVTSIEVANAAALAADFQAKTAGTFAEAAGVITVSGAYVSTGTLQDVNGDKQVIITQISPEA